MELIVNGSSSKGNSYFLKSSDGILAIEAGMPLMDGLISNNLEIKDIVGCLVTHEHGDHAKYAKAYSQMGVDVYASKGTFSALRFEGHRIHVMIQMQWVNIGQFRVLPFIVKHDASEPFGFVIQHKEMGNCLFITDSWFCPNRFAGLNQIIVEANYDEDILNDNIKRGDVHRSVATRVTESHMPIKVLKEMLDANDLSKVNNIVLIHLSAQNSDAKRFQKEISDQTGKTVTIARPGLTLNFNKRPF
jgi:phosphoribosyl 1,2-cyclic phosphodiesterase